MKRALRIMWAILVLAECLNVGRQYDDTFPSDRPELGTLLGGGLLLVLITRVLVDLTGWPLAIVAIYATAFPWVVGSSTPAF